ncbi:MAG: hypothetical protein J5787_08140 [Alphaproteobacteria bacterium]|nr:hypothetical protein [Alphaproteobacteria bacterium]
MANNQSNAALSASKNSFNLLKEWRDSKEAQKAYFHQANSLLRESDDEIRQMKRQNAEDAGKILSKAGASGIDLSSFNDAFLSEDLKNIRDIYDKQKQAQESAQALRKQAANERKNRRDKAFSYSVGLFSDLMNLGL